jgi:RNA polymerase sigma-70 factor (ECF subfamily)
MIQDALLQAHKSFAGFQGLTVAEFVMWLRQVAIRTAGRSVRDLGGFQNRTLTRDEPLDNWAEVVVDEGSSPSARAIRHEQVDRVAEALSRLPDEQQQVIRLRVLDGLPHAAVAEQLGRTVVATRMLYLRALRRLREIFPE